MKKLIKRLTKTVALTITATTILSLCGCFLFDKNSGKIPEYEDDREMMIAGWDSPMNTLEDIQIAKDMGLTHMFLDSYHAKRGTKAYEDALKLYEQVGLNVIVQTGSGATVESTIKDNTNYADFPIVTHINYWDEPYYSNIARIAELAEQHIDKYGNDILFFGNLFPNSATPVFEGHTYKEYVKHYADSVLMQFPEEYRWLSADIYPLDEKNGGSGSAIRSNWLPCIETLALQAKESNAKTHFFLQATEHYGYRAVKEEDIRFQFYVNMAFGVQGFSYFTYADSVLSDFEHSFVARNESGVIHDTYYNAQKVNNEIKKFDHVYLNYTWQGTLPIVGNNNEEGYNLGFDGLSAPLEDLSMCKRWDASEDALVGTFVDENGYEALMVVNYTDPADLCSNLVRFEFNDVSKVRMYRGGVAYDYKISNNRLDVELDPGEGVFIILVP